MNDVAARAARGGLLVSDPLIAVPARLLGVPALVYRNALICANGDPVRAVDVIQMWQFDILRDGPRASSTGRG